MKLTDKISIGGHEPVFIIAEVGSNWSTLEDCLYSINMAKTCGADAVKFQAFDNQALYGVRARKHITIDKLDSLYEISWDPERVRKLSRSVRYQIQDIEAWYIEESGKNDGKITVAYFKQYFKEYGIKPSVLEQMLSTCDQFDSLAQDVYMDGQLPLEWLPKLKAHADAKGIELMCSAFSPELIDAVNPYVNVHKVASAELTHKRMLEKLRKIGKPVILSTGASGDGDIGMALDCLGSTPTALLYCISAYPARTTRLEHIDLLRARFDRLVGFSDHSTDIFTIPAEAIFQHQACILEKHVNFIDGLQSPDSPHSLTTSEFKLMVTRCRNNLAIEARQSHEESEMVTKHNRRLIVVSPMAAGDRFVEGSNFGIYRSLSEDTRGVHAFLVDQVNGTKATREIKAGEAIGPGDFA